MEVIGYLAWHSQEDETSGLLAPGQQWWSVFNRSGVAAASRCYAQLLWPAVVGSKIFSGSCAMSSSSSLLSWKLPSLTQSSQGLSVVWSAEPTSSQVFMLSTESGGCCPYSSFGSSQGLGSLGWLRGAGDTEQVHAPSPPPLRFTVSPAVCCHLGLQEVASMERVPQRISVALKFCLTLWLARDLLGEIATCLRDVLRCISAACVSDITTLHVGNLTLNASH
jgi:hypothetical protein